MDRHRTEGKLRQVKGAAKDTLGKLAGDSSTRLEGKADKIAGRAQETYGKMKDEIRAERERRDERHGRR